MLDAAPISEPPEDCASFASVENSELGSVTVPEEVPCVPEESLTGAVEADIPIPLSPLGCLLLCSVPFRYCSRASDERLASPETEDEV